MKAPKTVGSKSAEAHAEILIKNYQQYFSKDLVVLEKVSKNGLDELWHADFVVVSHGIEDDPIFNFGNLTALKLFEFSLQEFTQLPSRKSAEIASQKERNKLLAEVTKNGYINNYTGVRVSSTGKKFFIENAEVWNLYDENNKYYGQSAMFQSWRYI